MSAAWKRSIASPIGSALTMLAAHPSPNTRKERICSMVGFMGCYAAINALKLARHIVLDLVEQCGLDPMPGAFMPVQTASLGACFS